MVATGADVAHFPPVAPSKTNLPHLRIAFRSELLQGEKEFIAQVSQKEITNTAEVRLATFAVSVVLQGTALLTWRW